MLVLSRTIFDVVDNNTIVFVLGDHGMTPTGDHGGGSKWETEAALLVYSPRPLFNVDEVISVFNCNLLLFII